MGTRDSVRRTDTFNKLSIKKGDEKDVESKEPLAVNRQHFKKNRDSLPYSHNMNNRHQSTRMTENKHKFRNGKILPSKRKRNRFRSKAKQISSSMENVDIKEHVNWLCNSTTNDLDDLSRDVLECWLKIGPRKKTIDDEVNFCDPDVLHQVLKSKSMLDRFDRKDVLRARSSCNPFEAVRCSIFQNRAAVKMANLDAIFNFMFTDPKDENGNSLIKDILYFVDVCGGPGGFSEYIFWRKKWQAKGFGFTLKNQDDFKLHAFMAGNTETFDTYYGVQDDGNILDPENIESLQTYVLKQTHGSGVHFMMADGAFSVENKNVQEITSKQLYLCQCLTALSLVRHGGSFIVKLFDIFTLFSAGLVYLMYKCFKQISIVKPNSSRPGNSERYLIAKYRKDNTETIRTHLMMICERMWDNIDSNVDVLELVPCDIIKEDHKFFNYLYESNSSIGRNQVASLLKMADHCNKKSTTKSCQTAIRDKCLKAWMLPISHLKINLPMYVLFKQLLGDWYHVKDFLLAHDQKLTNKSNLPHAFRDQSDWYFVPVDSTVSTGNGINIRTFFMSLGGHNVLYFDNGKWKPLQNIALEIPTNTLMYGEIVTEFNGESKSQTPLYTLHIIDGIVLGCVDIRRLQLKDRLKMCELFAASINKPSKLVNVGDKQISTAPILCKKLYPLNAFRQFFDELNDYTHKDGRKKLGLRSRNRMGPERWYIPSGLLFFNEMKPNIEKAFSKTYQKHYFVDKSTGNSFFQDQIKDPESIYSSFKTTFVNRYSWEWKPDTQVNKKSNRKDDVEGILNRYDFDYFIYKSSIK